MNRYRLHPARTPMRVAVDVWLRSQRSQRDDNLDVVDKFRNQAHGFQALNASTILMVAKVTSRRRFDRQLRQSIQRTLDWINESAVRHGDL